MNAGNVRSTTPVDGAWFVVFALTALAVGEWLSLSLAFTLAAVAVVAVIPAIGAQRGDRLGDALRDSAALVTITEYDVDGEGHVVCASPAMGRLLGLEPEEIIGRSWGSLLGRHGPLMVEQDLAVLDAGAQRVFTVPISAQGHRWTLMASKSPVDSAHGRAVGMVALDIGGHRHRDRLLRMMFDSSPVPMARLAVDATGIGSIVDTNQAMADLLEVPITDLRGMVLDDFIDPRDHLVADGLSRELRVVTGKTERLWVQGTVSVLQASDFDGAFAIAVLEDMTARREAETRLLRQAEHDALTGLPNRYVLNSLLAAAVSRLWTSGRVLAVLFCDLDGFKGVNDTLGHGCGDAVLVQASGRLAREVGDRGFVSRLGGDEFVVVAEGLLHARDARDLGERVLSVMREPFDIEGREVRLGVSVGVAVTTDPGADPETLVRRADLAMYSAKTAGRNRVAEYEPSLERAALSRQYVLAQLRERLATGAVGVHYQPITGLRDGTVSAVEGLVRIAADPPVPAVDFIRAAEDNGLMPELGRRVLEAVLRDQAAWARQGLRLRVHLNTSLGQLCSDTFAEDILAVVTGHDADPSLLCFEVADTPQLHDGTAIANLNRLHELGFRVGIDGFAAGGCGLDAVKVIPADYVKIDRSLISDLATSREDPVIVQAIVTVAHDLGRRAIATGVETQEQVRILTRLGCDEVQGFVNSAPTPPEAVAQLLESSSRR
ncbi:MAG: EAL domain-containing protein [Candidatus Nanopelagicales bacterium]|jgi:diguanylate cyclase (GGDEF)-like protein|nr:EAL domain-containing protein [Candidatus Nanopelagicales bacterium]MCU0295114.1 EAL domain-containing protein [Candidatus Nanopelagicales bacterium]MCU0298754.1 EAL domain-containing protein [Candidatus Nanopelagicales bacterium]